MSKKQIKVKNSKFLKKKSVLLKGPVLTNSGYGVHTRQIFKALLERKNIDLYIQPTEWGNTAWILDKDFDGNIIDDIVMYSKKKFDKEKYDESYQVLLPDEWKDLAHINIGATAGFEADIVKKSWIDYINSMDFVLTPSKFTRNAFLKTSLLYNKKLTTEIIPTGLWYYETFNENIESYSGLFDNLKYDKNILIIAQVSSNMSLSDRKNFLKTAKCAIDFVKDKEIGIILKVNFGKYSNSECVKITNFLKETLGEESLKKVSLLFGSATINELQMLYSSQKISCMLSGTRAEGWGLPFIEAAACGLPIIATDYSAYKEFLGDDFLRVNYDLKDFRYDTRFVDLETSPKWAEFNFNDMLLKLKEFFSNEEKYEQKALKRQKIIKQCYNSKTIINSYKDFFRKEL